LILLSHSQQKELSHVVLVERKIVEGKKKGERRIHQNEEKEFFEFGRVEK